MYIHGYTVQEWNEDKIEKECMYTFQTRFTNSYTGTRSYKLRALHLSVVIGTR